MNNLLKIQGLSKTFSRGGDTVKALDNVSISLEKETFAAVSGPSGSGKSTLLNIVGTLDRPDSGSVSLEGEEIDYFNEGKLEDIRSNRLGFIFQDFNLIPVLSAVENVEMPLYSSNLSTSERREKAEQALDAVGLADRMEHRPNQLSGGQQQRVAVARALAGTPELVLGDEPTANLDTKSAFLLLDVMENLNQTLGTAFLFSTHDPRILERAKTVFTLEDGVLQS
ncbi:MAG: ABC transporter ATP-binding protein [Rhodospirillales bacterium]|nr:ABC transporter ATP-binding protein [Rhodospirillales bacterium]